MPPAGDSALRHLLDEASDLIESPTATHVLTLLLDTVFSQLTDVALRSQAFKIPDPFTDPSLRVQEVIDITGDEFAEPGQVKAKLATILAVITRQAHTIGNGVPNTYVQALEGVKEVEAFAAVVYSSNLEHEAATQAEAAGQLPAGFEEATRVEHPVAEQPRGIASSTWGVLGSVWGRVVGN